MLFFVDLLCPKNFLFFVGKLPTCIHQTGLVRLSFIPRYSQLCHSLFVFCYSLDTRFHFLRCSRPLVSTSRQTLEWNTSLSRRRRSRRVSVHCRTSSEWLRIKPPILLPLNLRPLTPPTLRFPRRLDRDSLWSSTSQSQTTKRNQTVCQEGGGVVACV